MIKIRPTVVASLMAFLSILVILINLSSSFVIPSGIAAKPLPFASPTMLGGRILIQVVADIAVFRTGPSRGYPIITRVKRANKIELSGISQDRNWYMFKYDQKDTWISADFAITQIIQGDPIYLPIIYSPATPTPAPVAAGGKLLYDPLVCNFDNTMSDEAQDALVQQMTDAMTASDWHQVGVVARRLYRCPMTGVFFVLYTQDVQTKLSQGLSAVDQGTASAAFQAGWAGQ